MYQVSSFYKMLNLFLCLSFSFFVPPSVLNQPLIPTLAIGEVVNMSLEDDTPIFGFALNSETKLFKQIQSMVLQASVITDNVTFVFIKIETISNYDNYNSVSPHTFFIIRKGEIQHCFPLPDTYQAFFPMIDFFASENKHVFNQKEELFEYLGYASFSILTPPSNLSEAFNLQNLSSPAMGYISIILCTQELIHEVTNSSTTTFGFYRLEDDYIQALGDTVEDVYMASYPIYRILRSDDLRDRERATLCFMSDPLTKEQKDYMRNVAEQQSTFIVGWADSVLKTSIGRVSPLRDDVEFDISFVSLEYNYYYDVRSVFTVDFLRAVPFNATEWTDRTMQVINLINDGKLKPVYKSEDEPPVNATIQKLVGTTYANFVESPEGDCLVLFMRPSCPHCTRFMPLYQQIAQEFRENNINIRFGYIDITKNSSPKRFPTIYGVPHLVLFRNNGTNTTTVFCQRERNEIVRFLKEESTANVTLDYPPIDVGKLSAFLFESMMTMTEYLDENDQEAFQNYLTKEMKLVDELKKSPTKHHNTVETEEMGEEALTLEEREKRVAEREKRLSEREALLDEREKKLIERERRLDEKLREQNTDFVADQNFGKEERQSVEMSDEQIIEEKESSSDSDFDKLVKKIKQEL